jgi:hypothetical protein
MIPPINNIKIRRHVAVERPLLKPFRSNREASGRNNIDSIAAIVRGTKNVLAKYNPAKTAKAIINIKAVFERDTGIVLWLNHWENN